MGIFYALDVFVGPDFHTRRYQGKGRRHRVVATVRVGWILAFLLQNLLVTAKRLIFFAEILPYLKPPTRPVQITTCHQGNPIGHDRSAICSGNSLAKKILLCETA